MFIQFIMVSAWLDENALGGRSVPIATPCMAQGHKYMRIPLTRLW